MSSSLNEAPPPSLEKFACIFVKDAHRLEWYAFDVSDDRKLNQTLPPLSLSIIRYVNHHLDDPPSLHEDDESRSKVYLKPIATASSIDHKWYDMWAILDNYLYRIFGGSHSTRKGQRQCGANLVERICIKDISPDSASKWEPVDSMPIFVDRTRVLVLGGKLYCLGGVNDDRPGSWAVAYDPDKAVWQCLPDPPNRPKSVVTIFSASMEKSTLVEGVGGSSIVVGSPADGVLQIYNPDAQRWVTHRFDIKGSSLRLADLVGMGGCPPIAVDNKLYWYSVCSGEICAYDLSTEVWSMARLPIHDDEHYFTDDGHFPPRLAHLGSDKFCLFWVSLLAPHNEDFSLPKREDFITRLHCLKFQVTAFAGNLHPNSGGTPLDVSIMSCQSHLVSGFKDFIGGLGLDGHLGSNSSDVRCPIPDSFGNFEAPGSTVTMQEEMAVEVPGMKRNLVEYGGGSEPSSSKHYRSAPSYEEVQVLKNEVETLKDLCRMQEEKLFAYAEQLENKSQLIDDHTKKFEQLEAFIFNHMVLSRFAV